MKRYQTTETVRLPAGMLVELTDGQAASRRHLLTAQEDTWYIAKSPLEFKAGEVIGLVSAPLALAQALVSVDDDDELDLGEPSGIDQKLGLGFPVGVGIELGLGETGRIESELDSGGEGNAAGETGRIESELDSGGEGNAAGETGRIESELDSGGEGNAAEQLINADADKPKRTRAK